jgi:hypothetical protein
MGLSFLNKKTWHPGSFANIEKVWIAEQKHRELEKKQIENQKKLKEERQIEELKKLQIEAGLIPSSHLQRLDWMYQGPEVTQNITTSEEALIGKSRKEKPEEKKLLNPVFQESYSNPNNEVFTKIHEDPLYVIKREEQRQRKEIEENPYKMKMLLKQVESELHTKKKDKKERKMDKKEKRRDRHDSPEDSITTPSFAAHKSKSSTPQVYGLIDKFGQSIKIDSAKRSSLGPNEDLYRERQALREEEDRLRNKSHGGNGYKHLSEKDKEKLREEMEDKARKLDGYKHTMKPDRDSDRRKDARSHNDHNNIQPDFIAKVGKDAYSGDFDLQEQLRRKAYKYK